MTSMFLRRALALLLLAAGLGCGGSDKRMTLRYPRSTEAMLNPERGFTTDVDLVAGGDYSYVRDQGYTLGYALVRLDAYRTSPLTETLLEALRIGFAAARKAGIKVIPRFVYNHEAGGHDATKWQILAHLAQLTPVLTANADVIAVMDAGFIGAWGEWHSSTSGLDNQRDRGDILWAILAALPPSRTVTLRRPSYKLDAYGAPLTEAQAFDGSPASRVGHHNSCFLASDTDLGTYAGDIAYWMDFVAQDGRFTPVGGETCELNPPRSDCATATAELARFHWSFLNSLFRRAVLDGWDDQGCYEEIARDLGYVLQLRSASFDHAVAPGGVLRLGLRIVNTGYAAMYNARPVLITLDDQTVVTSLDPRRWEPGVTVEIEVALRIPASMAPGQHRLGLWLPDADPRLADRADYAVRLANTRWDAPHNIITDELVVDPAAPGPVDPSATALTVLP